jgi:hypothetical protein
MENPSPNTDTPEDADVGTLQDAIEAKQAEVLEAQNDHTASATLSAAVQLMTATRLQNVNTQFDELRDDMNRKKPLQVAPDTFAKADKLRSVAAENFEKWTSAAQMKHSAMSSEVSIADAAIDDAIAALQEQKITLKTTFETHNAAWSARNLIIEANHKEKVIALEIHCRNLAPPSTATHDQLQEALAAQERKFLEIIAAAEAKHTATIAAFQQEAETRHEAAMRDAEAKHCAILHQARGEDIDAPCAMSSGDDQSNGELQKGKSKGKGKDKDHGMY